MIDVFNSINSVMKVKKLNFTIIYFNKQYYSSINHFFCIEIKINSLKRAIEKKTFNELYPEYISPYHPTIILSVGV